jgi:hypothetical protein
MPLPMNGADRAVLECFSALLDPALLQRETAVAQQMLRIIDGRLVLRPIRRRASTRSPAGSYGNSLKRVVLPKAGRLTLVVRPQRDSNPCFGLERATS